MWWIVKGTFIGLWLLSFGTIVFLTVFLRRLGPLLAPPGQHWTVDINLFARLTVRNISWWVAVVTCIVLGFAIVRSWSVPLGVWIALAVSGLIPAGCLALFITLVKLKQASQGHV